MNARGSFHRAFDDAGCVKAAGVRPCQSATVPPGTHHRLWGGWAAGLPDVGGCLTRARGCFITRPFTARLRWRWGFLKAVLPSCGVTFAQRGRGCFRDRSADEVCPARAWVLPRSRDYSRHRRGLPHAGVGASSVLPLRLILGMSATCGRRCFSCRRTLTCWWSVCPTRALVLLVTALG